MRRGSAASARSRQTRTQRDRDPARPRPPGTRPARRRRRAAAQGESSEPRSAWNGERVEHVAEPGDAPERRPGRPPRAAVTATAPARAVPRRRAAAIHSGTRPAAQASPSRPRSSAAGRPQRERDAATSAGRDDVVRAARGRDHHRREARASQRRRERRRRRRAADAPALASAPAARSRSRTERPSRLSKPSRTGATSAPACRRGRPAADRCRRAPARPACRLPYGSAPSSSLVAPAIDANATSLTRPPGIDSSTKRRRRGRRRRTSRRTPRGRRSNTNRPVAGTGRGPSATPTQRAGEIGERHACRDHAPLDVALVQQHDRHGESGQRGGVEVLDPPQRQAQGREQEQREQRGEHRRRSARPRCRPARARPRSG